MAAPRHRGESNQKTFEKQGRSASSSAFALLSRVRDRTHVGSIRAAGMASRSHAFAGTYFQFDGRSHVDAIMEHDVQKIAQLVTLAYVKDRLLGEGAIQQIEPVTLTRYDRGVELVVNSAQVNRETIRLKLSLPADGDDDVVTGLTVQWPLPLSKTFSERGEVEK